MLSATNSTNSKAKRWVVPASSTRSSKPDLLSRLGSTVDSPMAQVLPVENMSRSTTLVGVCGRGLDPRPSQGATLSVVEGLLGIGRLARASGLTVSALRFYDSAGVLTPAAIDPRTGYRWYTADQLVLARLIARLRRVQMPLVDIRQVLNHRHDPDRIDALLTTHLLRLEHGLAEGRRELSAVHSVLKERSMTSTTLNFAGPDFTSALAAVRFAVSVDPELSALGGVLFDIADDSVTLVATDRYRLAVASLVSRVDGPAQAAVVPTAFADRIAAADATEVHLTLDGDTVTAHAGPVILTCEAIPEAFPDYHRLLPANDTDAIPIGAQLRAAIATAPCRTQQQEDGVSYAVTVIGISNDGQIVVCDQADGIGVNREFLLQAIDAGGDGQLMLSLDGPIAPLVVRSPRSVSLLMPMRL
jgi:DNA polymerase-3 subunit beta